MSEASIDWACASWPPVEGLAEFLLVDALLCDVFEELGWAEVVRAFAEDADGDAGRLELFAGSFCVSLDDVCGPLALDPWAIGVAWMATGSGAERFDSAASRLPESGAASVASNFAAGVTLSRPDEKGAAS